MREAGARITSHRETITAKTIATAAKALPVLNSVHPEFKTAMFHSGVR
jgi:hypothetical protein